MRKKIAIESRAFSTYVSTIVRINGALSFRDLINRYADRADVILATQILPDRVTFYVESWGMGDSELVRFIENAIRKMALVDPTGILGTVGQSFQLLGAVVSEGVQGTAADVRGIVKEAARPAAAFGAGVGTGALAILILILVLSAVGRGR